MRPRSLLNKPGLGDYCHQCGQLMLSSRHVCPPLWECVCAENEFYEDNFVRQYVHADTAEEAAIAMVKRYEHENSSFSIAGGREDMLVAVYSAEDSKKLDDADDVIQYQGGRITEIEEEIRDFADEMTEEEIRDLRIELAQNQNDVQRARTTIEEINKRTPKLTVKGYTQPTYYTEKLNDKKVV